MLALVDIAKNFSYLGRPKEPNNWWQSLILSIRRPSNEPYSPPWWVAASYIRNSWVCEVQRMKHAKLEAFISEYPGVLGEPVTYYLWLCPDCRSVWVAFKRNLAWAMTRKELNILEPTYTTLPIYKTMESIKKYGS